MALWKSLFNKPNSTGNSNNEEQQQDQQHPDHQYQHHQDQRYQQMQQHHRSAASLTGRPRSATASSGDMDGGYNSMISQQPDGSDAFYTNRNPFSTGSSVPPSDMSILSRPLESGERRSSISRVASGGGGVFQSIISGRAHASAAAADAEMERKVFIAARHLGEEVQKIVMIAKMGGQQQQKRRSGGQADPDAWKIKLLNLLGGADMDIGGGKLSERSQGIEGQGDSTANSDIDVLLENSTCDKFVLRCVENELPPNLIHCLRLLRVLELQAAHTFATIHQRASSPSESNSNLHIMTSVSKNATQKVSQLLCLLCTDSSVGEQLRPHLFGLLALSGASYPINGVHIAVAASNVIIAFSQSCLSTTLIWFLHDRKMIVHMTDDVKELCGMTVVTSPASVTLCLYSKAAEVAGLWVVALRTVVNLIKSASAFVNCGSELLRDFDSAGGYNVLCYAIANSGSEHVKKLLELVTYLVTCTTENSENVVGKFREDGGVNSFNKTLHLDDLGKIAAASSGDNIDVRNARLATNPTAFEIVEDLMVRSVPFLIKYAEEHEGKKPVITYGDSVRELAKMSFDIALETLSKSESDNDKDDDKDDEKEVNSQLTTSTGDGSLLLDKESAELLTSELLVSTLQLYSDHSMNFSIIETRYDILSQYLLSFPTLTNISIKVMTLKTLEYVCTGLTAESNSMKPLIVVSEIFFCICKAMFRFSIDESQSKKYAETIEILKMDTSLLCDTLEKLLQYDDGIVQIMLDVGLLGEKLDEFLSLVMASPSRLPNTNQEKGNGKKDGTRIKRYPPLLQTCADEAYSALCRILKLVCQSTIKKPVDSSSFSESRLKSRSNSQALHRGDDLNLLLRTGVTDLGKKASDAALTVFETKLSITHDDSLLADVICVVQILDHFSECLGQRNEVWETTNKRKRLISVGSIQEERVKKELSKNDWHCVERACNVLAMLKVALATNELAQEAFRNAGGFESLVRLIFCLDDTAVTPAVDEGRSISRNSGDSVDLDKSEATKNVLSLLKAIFDILASLTTPVIKKEIVSRNPSRSSSVIDFMCEADFSTLMPSSLNCIYIRDKAFYTAIAKAIKGTGLLDNLSSARTVINLAFELVDSRLSLPPSFGQDEASGSTGRMPNINPHLNEVSSLKHPDAIRLVLGIAVNLPQTQSGLILSQQMVDETLKLCSTLNIGTTLAQIASCGMCRSLTHRNEFANILDDIKHPLYPRFMVLLRRIAAYNMSHSDFINLLRCIAAPVLLAKDDASTSEQGISSSSQTKNIRLPVISSSVSSKKRRGQTLDNSKIEVWQAQEKNLCIQLETLAIIAERGDRVARCLVGGDSLETITSYMLEIKKEDRLHFLAEKGRIRFLEVESVEAAVAKAAASTNNSANNSSISSTASSVEKFWAPMNSSGFSYSIWLRLSASNDNGEGSIFILDLSSPLGGTSGPHQFISIWYDIQSQGFNVLTSASHKRVCFPPSPLVSGVWHHVLLTFQPPKRSMLSRKSVFGLCVDGRPLEADIKTDSVLLPPTAKMYVGVPNPILASSGIVRGSLPTWALGSTLLLSTILGPRDATSMFAAGPDFHGQFWGDRPQRLSLAATATAAFAMLAESGEQGSVAGALRRRAVPEVEGAGHVMKDRGFEGGRVGGQDSDLLSAVGLLCVIPPEYVISSFRASSSTSITKDGSSSIYRQHYARRLVNIAKVNSNNEYVSTDAIVCGVGSVISPHSFACNIQWVGGPNILLPIVNSVRSSAAMALVLRLIRGCVHRHTPNLEMLQAGGGYRMLGLLLRQKQLMDISVLDQCFAFAVHGFEPDCPKENTFKKEKDPLKQDKSPHTWAFSDRWVFVDLDAMKYLLLNHQVWNLQASGPDLPLRLLSFLNGLVSAHSAHAAFNSRRLHLLGIVKWTLHLLLEAAELYSAGSIGAVFANGSDENQHRQGSGASGLFATAAAAYKNGWYVKPPTAASTAVGGDPGNHLLLACKTLLRRVLTFMLTPSDLETIAGAAIYTISIDSSHSSAVSNYGEVDSSEEKSDTKSGEDDSKLLPGSVARVYLIRLLEELVVDGVNEIVTANYDKKGLMNKNSLSTDISSIVPHAGGGTSANQSYLSVSFRRKKSLDLGPNNGNSPKELQAQAFLSAFAGILTPIWFACILEGCRDEASAAAVFRLLILMLQSSPPFTASFEEAGGFAPLVLSIPKFSTSPSITLSMLSQLLHAPILHLPCFGNLDSTQLCAIFDKESDATELIMNDSIQGGLTTPSDPSCSIFALLAECIGRNIQLGSMDNDFGEKARKTNIAVLQLLGHCHAFSSAFQAFCRTPDFLEPLAQALCLVHDEKLQKMKRLEAEEKQNDDAVKQLEVDESETPSSLKLEISDKEISKNSLSAEEDLDNDVFVSWPSERTIDTATTLKQISSKKKSRTTERRGSLWQVNTNESPTERFVGKVEEEGSGIGMVQLLHHVLSHAVLSGPLAAPLVGALFRSFPIHASPDQVEAYHLVLIEHCSSVVEDALQRGELIALANCVGVSSVLLDRLNAGFFTSEPVLETVKISLSILTCISSLDTYASRTLVAAEVDKMLIADAAHIARLTCLKALIRSRPVDLQDTGDDILKREILDLIGKNLKKLLFTHKGLNGYMSKKFSPPPTGSRQFQLWKSASLVRCVLLSIDCTYRDVQVVDEPDRFFVVALMSDIRSLLLQGNNIEMREKAALTVTLLLHERREIMSDILIKDIRHGDDRTESVDLMSHDGFGALLEQADTTSSDIDFTSFFQWLDKNQVQVKKIFEEIDIMAKSSLMAIGLISNGRRAGVITRIPLASTPDEAIENEQKGMLLKLTSQDQSDRTILGGLERSKLAALSHHRTAESHSKWKRQGFNDLSSGAMLWKLLLRQLKGSRSIWEGGIHTEEESLFSSQRLFLSLIKQRNDSDDEKSKGIETKSSVERDSQKKASVEIVKRWKLDLTEGYERQRRRLLPNYEFHSLYNLDEAIDLNNQEEGVSGIVFDDENDESSAQSDKIQHDLPGDKHRRLSGYFDLPGESMEATAALLKNMHLRKTQLEEDDYYDPEGTEDDDGAVGDWYSVASTVEQQTDADTDDVQTTTTAIDSIIEKQVDGTDMSYVSTDSEEEEEEDDDDEEEDEEEERDQSNNQANRRDDILASSYELIIGLLQAGDWPEKSYNVKRCTGLEVRQALMLWCHNAIYVIDGFEQTDGDGLKGKIKRLEKATSTYDINLRSQGFKSTEKAHDQEEMINSNKDFKGDHGKNRNKERPANALSDEVTYQHRSQRIDLSDIYSVYRRRYQLQQNALEFYDVNRNGTLLAFTSNVERDEVLSKVLNSPLPNSIFSSSILSASSSINYNKFMASLRAKITNQWVQGKMTNFDFIMHLNSFAGRSYNDLTQYPVFPWVLSDYTSDEIDLNDPNVYRDLSKPMGALGENRAEQFRERYESLESNFINEDDPPPFHYGTHYSCAAYVLNYLMRLEPFSRLALSLQGGRFDLADRLFHNVGSSWRSASQENLQDVRELIPEFFYLPEFLVNNNLFDFGTTQLGKTVHHVTLPPWAKEDPRRFIRINRQALESEYVSRNLHKWVDLIFGYKQRGREAVAALNTFVHVTYEGSVDLDAISDPIQRESTIAQIQNFGQTPSRLERRPFPARNVMVALKDKNIDLSALPYLSHQTPPLCIVGASHKSYLRSSLLWDTCKVGMAGQEDSSVGDMCLVKGQVLGVGKTCVMILPSKKYYRFGSSNNGVSVHVAMTSARYREVNRVLTIHDGMHRASITAAKPSRNGLYLVTGCLDSTVRVWKYIENSVKLQATLCGHEKGKITCIDVSTVFGTIVTGGADGNVFLWDLRTLIFVRELRHTCQNDSKAPFPKAVTSVSLNHKNGNILVVIDSTINMFDINGNLVGEQGSDCVFSEHDSPTHGIATDCPEWMENGTVAVTGHKNGDVRLWGIDWDTNLFVMRHAIPDKVHSCPITCLRLDGERQETLLIGDKSGKMSVCKTLQLESLTQQELFVLAGEMNQIKTRKEGNKIQK